ncbi:hypothetical protein DKE47_006385 [Acinetobacter nosocomialis]|nr:hypothetical protein DKE47_006385 [Acinetobacter nosocomialis]
MTQEQIQLMRMGVKMHSNILVLPLEHLKLFFLMKEQLLFSYLGEMYENGIGVEKSNLLAADAFYNAGVLYNKNNNKEKALSNLEKAIHLYPDHKKSQGFN